MILHKYVGQIIDKRVDESGHQPKFDPDDEDDMIFTFLPRKRSELTIQGYTGKSTGCKKVEWANSVRKKRKNV